MKTFKEQCKDKELSYDYIINQSKAITKELEKNFVDPGYIAEKCRNIQTFLKEVLEEQQ